MNLFRKSTTPAPVVEESVSPVMDEYHLDLTKSEFHLILLGRKLQESYPDSTNVFTNINNTAYAQLRYEARVKGVSIGKIIRNVLAAYTQSTPAG